MTGRAQAEAVIALALGAAVIGGSSLISDVRTSEPDLRASSFVSEKRGSMGLYRVLERCGVPVEQARALPRPGDPTDATFVVLAPSEAITRDEAADLLGWADSGGRLVVIAAPPVPPFQLNHYEPLVEPLGLRIARLGGEANKAEVTDAWDLSAERPSLSWPVRLALEGAPEGSPIDERAGEHTDLVESQDVPVARSVAFGAAGGEIVVVSDEQVFSNQWLDAAENAYFAVNLLQGRGDSTRAVRLDEYHHGYLAPGSRPELGPLLAAQLTSTWPGRGVLVLLLAGLLYVLGAAVRMGAPLPDEPPERRTLSEHADALGRLLENARARTEALEMLAAGARRAVAQRTGLPLKLSPQEFDRRLGALGAPGARELATALETARGADAASRGEFVRIAAELARCRRRYVHGRG